MKQLSDQQYSRRNSLLATYGDRLGNTVLRHRTSLALNAAKVDAELASKAKTEFIAKMSHELRTPLNAIIGFSEILSDDNSGTTEPEKVPEYAKHIESSARHLLSIVNNILELSKIHSSRATLYTQQVDLEEVLDSCLVLFQETAKDNAIEIRCEVETDVPLIEADLTKIRQMIINLVSNAVKFTPTGGQITITIDTQDGNFARLVVSDTGIGMSEEDLDVALEPFGQVDGSLKRQYEGSGLGLPIVLALAEMHKGSLQVHSELNQGTTVTLLLPFGGTASDRLSLSHNGEAPLGDVHGTSRPLQPQGV